MRKLTRTAGWMTCLFALAVVPLGCGGDDSTGTPGSGNVTVQMLDNRFSPAEIRVAQGATVHWVNNGSSAHTVTADNGSFNSDTRAPGTSFDQQFTTKGTFAYHCNFHPEMTGTVVVE